MSALFWLLLSLTVDDKLGGPPYFFMYLMMTPSSWRPLHSCQLTPSRNNEWSLISLYITPKVIQGATANQHCFEFNLSKMSFSDIKLGSSPTIWAKVAHVQLYIASRYIDNNDNSNDLISMSQSICSLLLLLHTSLFKLRFSVKESQSPEDDVGCWPDSN